MTSDVLATLSPEQSQDLISKAQNLFTTLVSDPSMGGITESITYGSNTIELRCYRENNRVLWSVEVQ